MSNRRRSGFIFLRSILALFIVMTIMPLSTLIVLDASKLKFDHEDVSNEIALLQLRRILNIAYDIENSYDSLKFIYHNKTYELSLINKRLVLSPGYQMFLNDVDNLYFLEEGNVIYLVYEKKGKESKTALTYANGIYLADFYDNDDGGYSD